MKLDRRVRALDLVACLTGSGLGDGSVEKMRRGRVSRLPRIPLVGRVVETAAEYLVLGQPHRDVQIDELEFNGPSASMRLRRYVPPGVAADAPVFVYLHGGGWCTGAPHLYDWFCTTVAQRTGMVVVAPTYRLAPEHEAPAAVLDAIVATEWVDDNRDEIGATGPVFVGGDSAGGNLAALVAIEVPDRVAAQVLIYPATDLTGTSPSLERLATAPILPKRTIDAFRELYLGDLSGDEPHVSPMHVDDLIGLPPALVITAEQDPLVDEGKAYVARLQEAGVAVAHREFRGEPHGFLSLPGICDQAEDAMDLIVDFIGEQDGR